MANPLLTGARRTVAGMFAALLLVACDSADPVTPPDPAAPAVVRIVPATTFLQPGQARQLSLEVLDSTGAPVPSYSATWTSDANDVATVTAFGEVTAVRTGTARIRATVSALTAEIPVVVTTTSSGARTWNVLREGENDASLLALWDDGAGTAWAGGSYGTIWKSVDGGPWIRVPAPADSQIITGIWGASPTDLWATGAGGVLLRGDGTSWQRVASPIRGTLLGVWGLDATHVWAFADGGVIARWDGRLWSVQGTDTNDEIWGLGGSSPSDLWAVGNNGTILRYDGLTWRSIESPTSALLLDVWVESPTSAFAVGTGGTVLRWDGGDWTRMNTPAAVNLFALLGRSSRELYAAGNNGAFWRFDGAQWTALGIGSGQNLRALASSSVVGGGVRAAGWFNAIYRVPIGGRPIVERLDALLLSAWTDGSGPEAATYVVGLGSAVGVRRGDSLQWLDVPGANDLYGISGSGPNDIVAVGDTGAIIRFDGTRWQIAAERTPRVYRGVWTTGPNEHVIVGEAGTILRSNGTGWISEASGTNRFLRAVWGRSASALFAVGDSGLVLRYDGTRWQSIPTGVTNNLRGVWGSSSSDVYFTGDRGALLRWDGERVSVMVSPTTRDLRGIWGRGPTDVYAVGDSGTVLRFDGAGWRTIDATTRAFLYGVTGGGSGRDITLVGARGAVVRGRD